VAIGVGDHPTQPGERPYNRMSFTFTTGYPGYSFQFVDTLIADGGGQPITTSRLGRVAGRVQPSAGAHRGRHPLDDPVEAAGATGGYRYVVAIDVEAR